MADKWKLAVGVAASYTDEQIALYGTTGFIPKGSWDASTNTPHLEDGVGSLGWTYEVTIAGTQFGHNFLIGDKVFYNANNKWDRSATGVESEAPMVVAYVDENTEYFPTTRPSGLPLKNGDYVSVKSTATLPFVIENIAGEKIPFDAYGDKAEFNSEDWQEKSYEAGKTNEIGIKNPVEEGITGDEEYQNELNKKYSNEIKIGKSVISVKRLGEYLYEATYDGIADYVEGVNNVIGGCSSFVRGGKTYRSFDLNYNNVAEFIVKTKDFDGIALIQGMNDGNLDKEKIAQLPYHLADGCNRHGIVVTEHILFNDFNFVGTGTKENDLTKLPTIILQNVKSMAELTTNEVVNNFLANAKLPTALVDLEYALQFLITDGITTYSISPSNPPVIEEEDTSFFNGIVKGIKKFFLGEEKKNTTITYEFVDISALPKQTNFKWVNKEILERNDSDLQNRPIGISRWNLINENTKLADLRFTLAYESNARLDEFIGVDGTTKDSTDAELQVIYEKAHTEYLKRKRDGKTWHSVHSVIYNSQGMESLCVQENYDKDYLESGKVKDVKIDNVSVVDENGIAQIPKNEKPIIDVPTLPTTDIDDNIYYRTGDIRITLNSRYDTAEGVEADENGITVSGRFYEWSRIGKSWNNYSYLFILNNDTGLVYKYDVVNEYWVGSKVLLSYSVPAKIEPRIYYHKTNSDGTGKWYLVDDRTSFDNDTIIPDDNGKFQVNPNKYVDKTNDTNKVYGTDEDGEQTTYDVDSFGKVDDVKVDGTSVVTDKVANIDLSGIRSLITKEATTRANADTSLQGDISNLETNKQDKLISGTNIKTINNQSILEIGNLETTVKLTKEEYEEMKETGTLLPNTAYAVESEGGDNSISKQDIFNIAHPVNSTYPQYTTTDNPNDLFNGNGMISSWEKVELTECYFQFDNTKEVGTIVNEELPNIKGSSVSGINAYVGGAMSQTKDNVGAKIAGGSTWLQANSLFDASYGQINADGATYKAQADSCFKNGGKVHPQGQVAILWKRVS